MIRPPTRRCSTRSRPTLPANVELVEMDTDINDDAFAVRAADLLIERLGGRQE